MIMARDMMVEGTIKHLKKNKKDLKTRTKRNRLILEAAIRAAKDLKENYKETITILEENKKVKFIS